jgi:Pentapeptide repeats (8 copies)
MGWKWAIYFDGCRNMGRVVEKQRKDLTQRRQEHQESERRRHGELCYRCGDGCIWGIDNMSNTTATFKPRPEFTRYWEYNWFFRALRGTVVILILGVVGAAIYNNGTARESFSVNVFTGVMSAVATALIFDELSRKRSQDELKRQLIDDAASKSNETAKNAVHQIRRKGWLADDDGQLLRGANLRGANLKEADLHGANLQEADLRETDLRGADLRRANLYGADLSEATLQGADLSGADLSGVNLSGASLQDANLRTANLHGADLGGATLRGTMFLGVGIFDEKTILPDGAYWTPETDTLRFIDP